MTIKTNFDYIIAIPDEQEANYPHLIDAEQLLNLEFVGLEFLDEDSTVSSYSDDDSTIESFDTEGDRVDLSAYDIEIPLAGSRRRERRTSRRRLEEMIELLELESQLLLAGRRGRRESSRRPRTVETNEEDSVDLARSRVNRNERTRYAGDALEEDSLRLTRTRVPPLRRTRHDQDDDEEVDYSINRDFSMPLSPMPRGSIIRRSSSSQKFQPNIDKARSF
jgi:hypothetical protein